MSPGTGSLSLGGYIRGTPKAGEAGVKLDLSYRPTESIDLFAMATAGATWATATGLQKSLEALAGLRVRF